MSKPEEVYTEVDRINFIKASVKRKEQIKYLVWPERWDHLEGGYKEVSQILKKGEFKLPHHRCPVKNDFEPFTPDPRYTRPLPLANNKLYGWKYANSEVHATYRWEKRIASRYFLNQVNWPYGSQP